MIKNCPNIGHPDAKAIISKVGIVEFFRLYKQNNESIPNPDTIKPSLGNVDYSLKVIDVLTSTDSAPTAAKKKSKARETTIERKIVDGFLKDFGVTVTEYNNLKEDIGLNGYSAADIVTKSLAYEKGQSIMPEVAYFAYSMLGKQNNKAKSQLKYLINKWDKYKERFDFHSKAINEKEGFIRDKKVWRDRVRENVILDFLTDKIESHYKDPKEFKKELDTKWTSQDFSIWNKIVSWFEDLLSKFSNKYASNQKQLENYGLSIADEILNRNYEYFKYDLKEDQIQKYYNSTIDSDPYAKKLVEFGQKAGFILTGSLALRKAGSVYRTTEENLHDIDFVVPHSLVYKNNVENYKAIRSLQGGNLTESADAAMPYLKEMDWFQNFVKQYPEFKITNAFYGADHVNFESLTVSGVIGGKFYESTGTHDKEVAFYRKDKTGKAHKVKRTVKVKHKKGDPIEDSGYVVDMFVRLQPGQDEHEDYFKLWKEIMLAKLKMGRDKDFIDWKAFTPFTKSQDKFNFKFKGFRHINYVRNESNALEDTPIVEEKAPSKIEALYNKFYKSNPNKFYSELQVLGVPKNQIQMLKDWNASNPTDSLDEMISGIGAQFLYPVEIETTIEEGGNEKYVQNEDGSLDFEQTYMTDASPTSYYSNLTVPGGTPGTYREMDIRTPFIVPSIKSHAAFSNNNSIGWTRVADKENSPKSMLDSMINSGIIEKIC